MSTLEEYSASQSKPATKPSAKPSAKPAANRTIGQIKREGVAGAGIGEQPLTLWLITAIIIVYLYIRRSNLGIDLHPAEGKPLVQPRTPPPTVTFPVGPAVNPSNPFNIGPSPTLIPIPSNGVGGYRSPNGLAG